MTYQEAIKTSNYLEGAIRCTYARFYYDYGGKGNREDIKHLFSLQQEAVYWGATHDQETGKEINIEQYGIIEDKRGGDVITMWTNQLGKFTPPIVEVRPSFKKEIEWGRRKPGMLIRVNVEESVLNTLSEYIKRYSKTHKDFTYISNAIKRINNLYVKECSIDWQPMATDVIEQVKEEEQQIIMENLEDKQQQLTKSKRNLLLLGAAALLLK